MLWRLQGGMLLDCGEGTYGQLRRRYGAATDEIIAGLKCVWISHIHAGPPCWPWQVELPPSGPAARIPA